VAELADAPDSSVFAKKAIGDGVLFAQPDVEALPLISFPWLVVVPLDQHQQAFSVTGKSRPRLFGHAKPDWHWPYAEYA